MTGAPARLSFVAIATGFLAGGMLHTVLRLHGLKMPVNVFLPLIVTVTLVGSTAGAILASGGDRKSAMRLRWAECGLLLLGAWAFCENAHVSMMYLVRAAGAPALPPVDAGRHLAALVLSLPASAVPFSVSSRFLCLALRDAPQPAKPYALHLAAFGLGTISSYLATREVGAYVLLCVLTGLFVVLLRPTRWQAVVAVPILLVLGAYSELKTKKLFAWRVAESNHLGTYWSDYHKMDFLEFKIGADPCIAGVHNDFMLWYVCTNPLRDHLQRRQLLNLVARGRRDALVIGASGGVATQTLLESEPKLRRIVGVEIDDVIVSKFGSDFGRYNGHVFRRPNVQLLAAEGRAFLDRTPEQFDLIFIDGIDNGTVQFPLVTVFAENFCFTKEAYRRIFDRVLRPGGVLAIDAGGIREDLAGVFLAGMPADVEARAFWYVVADYPMVELPLFFILASRDAEAIDRLSQDIGGLGAVAPVRTDSPPAFVPTDDRPVLRDTTPRPRSVQLGFLVILIGGIAGLVGLTARLAVRRGQLNPGSRRWAALVFGICYSLCETYVVTKFARFFLSGPAAGTSVLITAFIAGSSVSNLWVAHVGSGRWPRLLPWFSSWNLAASLWALGALETPVLVGACAAWVGFSAGGYWPALLRTAPSGMLVPLYAFMGVGFAIGSILSILLLNSLGFHSFPVAAALLGLVGALILDVGGRGRVWTGGSGAGALPQRPLSAADLDQQHAVASAVMHRTFGCANTAPLWVEQVPAATRTGAHPKRDSSAPTCGSGLLYSRP